MLRGSFWTTVPSDGMNRVGSKTDGLGYVSGSCNMLLENGMRVDRLATDGFERGLHDYTVLDVFTDIEGG